MSRYLLLLLLTPVLFAGCSPNNVTVDNSLQQYFETFKVKGCFGFYDNGQGHFTIYNLPRYSDSSYAPGESFDILQSLVGLQTGALANDATVMPGNGLTLRKQLQSNFGGIASRDLSLAVGYDSLKKWVDSLRYGNRDLSDIRDSHLEYTHLKITADEQMGLIKKLYFDQLPFFGRSQKIVRDMMPVESNSNYRFVWKTAAEVTDGRPVGWVLGWIEENKHPYFFVLNYESVGDHPISPIIGVQIVKNILRSMGFFAGHK